MKRILIVDDHAVVREPLAAALVRFGYEAVCARDGVEAERMVHQQPPDLILLDLAMPRMDGLTFLKRLRANDHFKSLPVLVLTARSERNTVITAVKLGIDGYLLKSQFSLEELEQKVARCFSESQEGGEAGDNVASDGDECARKSGPASAERSEPPGSAGPAGQPAADGTAEAAVASETTAAAEPSAVAMEPPASSEAAPVSDAEPADERSLDDEPLPKTLEELKPIMTRSEIKQRIDEAEELRAFSPTVAVMLKLTNNPHCTIDQIVRAIGRDHAIALKLLKLANSAAYSRGEPVDSVRNAVLRIGLRQLRQAVLNIGVIEHFSSVDLGPYMDVRQFWEHAIACGLIASGLATEVESCDTETAFTMGLLHDAGRLVMHQRFGRDYDRACRYARHLGIGLERVESRMLLLSHADVMDRLLHAWKFPTTLVNPIVFHHLSAGSIRGQVPRELPLVATLGLANRYAHAMLLGSSGNLMLYPTDDLLTLLNVADERIEAILAMAQEQSTDMKLALLNARSNSDWPQVRDQWLERCGVPIRPIFVSARPRTDAFNVFLDQVRDLDDEAAPNVAVVHMGHVRERARLSEALVAAEHDAGVTGLPTIVLSTKGHLGLEGRAAERTWLVQEPVPIHAHRMADRLREAITAQPTQTAA